MTFWLPLMASPELIVIKRWTWKQFGFLAFAIAALLLLTATAGYLIGISEAIRLYEENNQLTIKANLLTSQADEVRSKLLMQQQISKVDKAANFHAGNSMDMQLQQIRELERELKFFRSIMAPEETLKGLQIARFSWQHSIGN